MSSTPLPEPTPHPPTRDTTRTYSTLGIVSAFIGLFVLPEMFGSAAIILGAYTWRKQQGNLGLYAIILGIIFMLIGIYFTAYIWLGMFLLE